MKPNFQLLVSALCAGALLYPVVASATDLAERPLRASVLVKPNIVFAMDDSGSMDMEMMLSTNDGAFWWDHENGTGWDATGKPHFNTAGSANSGLNGKWKKMTILFPNTVASGAMNYGINEWSSPLPPTRQFAWMRSSAYNPIYFDPAKTYQPWVQAYTLAPGSVGNVAGAGDSDSNPTTRATRAVRTYGAASKTAARSHPIWGSVIHNLTAGTTVASTPSADTNFIAYRNMAVPAGAKRRTMNADGSWNAWADVTTAYQVPAGAVHEVAMSYFQASYWKQETCTIQTDVLDDTRTCVAGPDGLSLQLYEIKPANYGSTAAYDAAIQNFANWFTYYRKRFLLLSGAMGQVLQPLNGMRVGVVGINTRYAPTMFDFDSTSASANGQGAIGLFQESYREGSTPLRETLKYIGDQFKTNTNIIQYACQRNAMFVVTDGFAQSTTGTDATPPSYDSGKSDADFGSNVSPYATTHPKTMADHALRYYINNPRSSFTTGQVPTSTSDTNADLHINTYGLTLGAKGTYWKGSVASSSLPASAAGVMSWVNPGDRDPAAVDDLWHATINGRGKMFTAQDATETSIAVAAGLEDVVNQEGAQAGVAVSSVNLRKGDSKAYLAAYNQRGWTGDLTANAIDPYSGNIVTATDLWSASALLTAKNWTTRVIATFNGSAGVGFTATNVGSTVNPGSNTYGTDNAAVMNYLRGARTGEGTTWRTRYSLMGSIINGRPAVAYADSVVFQPSGEGMLHAFDTATGNELWAYVPGSVLSTMGQTTQRAYVFNSQLDGTPTLADTGSNKILVAGLGIAGKGFYALDVANPRSLTEAQLAGRVLWEFPNGSTTAAVKNTIGMSAGLPKVVKIKGTSNWVALLTSGYNNAAQDGIGRLFVLNATSGAVSATLNADSGTTGVDPGLVHVTPFFESDGTVQYVYGGDELGNLWRFDLVNNTTLKIGTLLDASNNPQPVTAPVALVYAYGKRIVYVGTGRVLGLSDLTPNNRTQSVYAIADGGTTYATVRSGMVAQTYTAATDAMTSNPVNWASDRGWYVDLPSNEQAHTGVSVAFGAAVFTTNKSQISDCSASSKLYVVDALDGSMVDGLTSVATVLSSTYMTSGATLLRGKVEGSPAPGSNCASTNTCPCTKGVIASVMLGNGVTTQRCIAPNQAVTARRNSWRDVRR